MGHGILQIRDPPTLGVRGEVINSYLLMHLVIGYHLGVDTKGKLLLVRVDRIGDLVLSLPADQTFSEWNCTWLVAKGLGFIPQLASPQRKFAETTVKFSWGQFFSLWRWIRAEKFDRVLIFYAPAWVYLVTWLARIPLRFGRLSQWYSFLFLNRGFRQSRQAAERSELTYNFELATVASGAQSNPVSGNLRLLPSATDRFRELGLKNYFVVHPGMSGSARNWTVDGWVQLILELGAYGPVVVTGTMGDKAHLDPIEPRVRGRCTWLVGKLNSPELVELLSRARLVVAPSTGVVHLAASTGAPTIGIYSPVQSQSAVRWGPQGARVRTISPQVDCPATKECLGTTCPLFDCLGQVRVSDLLERAKELGAL